MMWWSNGMGWGGWISMTLVMVGFWALVIFAVVAIFRADRGPETGPRAPGADALGILDERFARGEVDADEYQARRSALRDVRSTAQR